MFAPTDYVDTTAALERKRGGCYAHALLEPDRYWKMQLQTMAFRGLESGYNHAEAFVCHVYSPAGGLPGR